MKTKKLVFWVAGAVFLVLTGFSAKGTAGVNINVGIYAPPPAFVIPAPPSLVVIPGTYAYFAPDVDVAIIFYHGFWYRPYEGRWYRARGYNGPWVYLAPARLPRILIGLPPDYRRIYPGHRRILYGEFNRNWRRWERNRYWDRDEHWREGRHKEQREEKREEHKQRGRHD